MCVQRKLQSPNFNLSPVRPSKTVVGPPTTADTVPTVGSSTTSDTPLLVHAESQNIADLDEADDSSATKDQWSVPM